jgi:hypothetical protein
MKAGHDASSARVRENQRRSRTRRKEYIQHLEQRLRTFEQLGIAATQEVQNAGKKVKSENDLLRSLLMHHGVTEKQIEEYLKLQRRPTESTISQLPSLVALVPTNSKLPTAPNQPPVDHNCSTATPSYWESNDPPHEVESTDAMYLHTKQSSQSFANILNCQDYNGVSKTAVSSVPIEIISQPELSDLESPGGIQGVGCPTRHVGAARLEYSPQANVTVKNMSIYDILDK